MADDLARDRKFERIIERLPNIAFDTIFDVGANVGQYYKRIRASFPSASIVAFEPGAEAFSKLQQLQQGDARCRSFQVALGDRCGSAFLAYRRAGAPTSWNRISDETGPAGETVEITTGDEFCRANGIDRIAFLKIDAEGHDLHVCRGFQEMLRASKIDLVQVEAALSNVEQGNLVPMNDLMVFFEPLGYRLYQIYKQKGMGPRPIVRRCDLVFISPDAIRQNLRR